MFNNSITSGSYGEATSSWSEMEEIFDGIKWVWNGWLALGFLVIIAASSGDGKSALVLSLCKCFTQGFMWPDKTPYKWETGKVLWCECEAAQALNIDRARKYDLDLVQFLTPFDDPLQDIDLCNEAHRTRIKQLAARPDINLIVVDSLRGSQGEDENSSHIIGIMKFLAEVGRDNGKAVLVTHHLRKKSVGEGEKVELDRLRGSSAIAQTARFVWAIDKPPVSSDVKTLRVIKSSIGSSPPTIGFRIKEDGVEFCDPPNAPEKISQLEAAEELLLELLSEGPMKANEIKEEFLNQGISWRTANTAKKKLGVESKKEGGKGGHSVWELPLRGKQKEIHTSDGV